jgi:hypothetical protein
MFLNTVRAVILDWLLRDVVTPRTMRKVIDAAFDLLHQGVGLTDTDVDDRLLDLAESKIDKDLIAGLLANYLLDKIKGHTLD